MPEHEPELNAEDAERSRRTRSAAGGLGGPASGESTESVAERKLHLTFSSAPSASLSAASAFRPDSDAPELRLAHLYPDQLNMYGDRGNILTFTRRCQWRGLRLRVVPLDLGDPLDPEAYDLIFIGGGQDKEQDEVARDLREVKAEGLRAAVEADMPVLTVCGGYQLLQRFYRPAEGPELEGIGIFDAWTIHKGKKVPRCIGNVAITWQAPYGETTLVGFENHGGRTYLGAGAQPLGRVLAGHGNNSEDKLEGCVYRNTYGTYLHGSLLPKNPHLADHLLRLALARNCGPDATALVDRPLDDVLEWQAHEMMLRRLCVQPRGRALPRRSADGAGERTAVTERSL